MIKVEARCCYVEEADWNYYVDKTLMIKELLDYGAQVELFTRPRRFGKTLALSMIRAWESTL